MINHPNFDLAMLSTEEAVTEAEKTRAGEFGRKTPLMSAVSHCVDNVDRGAQNIMILALARKAIEKNLEYRKSPFSTGTYAREEDLKRIVILLEAHIADTRLEQ